MLVHATYYAQIKISKDKMATEYKQSVNLVRSGCQGGPVKWRWAKKPCTFYTKLDLVCENDAQKAQLADHRVAN